MIHPIMLIIIVLRTRGSKTSRQFPAVDTSTSLQPETQGHASLCSVDSQRQIDLDAFFYKIACFAMNASPCSFRRLKTGNNSHEEFASTCGPASVRTARSKPNFLSLMQAKDTVKIPSEHVILSSTAKSISHEKSPKTCTYAS